MSNSLIVKKKNNSNDNDRYKDFTYILTFTSDNLDSSITIHFNHQNVDWMDDSNFVLSGGSLNCVLEGRVYLKNDEHKVLSKLFIWDTFQTSKTNTYVSVMKTTLESIHNLKLL